MTIINSVIAGGAQPSGTKPITTNGIHDVAGYANADVQVPTTAPAHYIEKTVDANGKLVNASNFINLNGATDLEKRVLYCAYNQNSLVTSVNFGSLITCSGEEACRLMCADATNLASVNWGSLSTVTGTRCFYSAFIRTKLTSVSISALESVSGTESFYDAFSEISTLTSFHCDALKSITGAYCFSYAFNSCPNLTVISFNSLSVISNSNWCSAMARGCSNLEHIYLGGLKASTFSSRTDQLYDLISSSAASSSPNGCTVHFPSNFDPSDPNHTFDASTLTGYPTFGGNASYIHVAFDLPATE